MDYIHIRNLEKYHPNYKDRNLIWCKVYFTMLNGDPEFELLEEIDQWRFVKFVMLEIQTRKPIPLEKTYLSRKGFNDRKRPIALTIKMLHNFIEVVTHNLETPYPREENINKKREYKEEEIRSIVVDLNEVLGTSYKPESKETCSLIMGLLNNGFSVDDFHTVHRKMFKNWSNDPKMHKYLRPITLYGSKFESYLNMKEEESTHAPGWGSGNMAGRL